MQAQKFGNLEEESDDELGEESLLETPLDKVEPYGLFRDALLSRCSQPHSPDPQGLTSSRTATRAAGAVRQPDVEPVGGGADDRGERGADGGADRGEEGGGGGAVGAAGVGVEWTF